MGKNRVAFRFYVSSHGDMTWFLLASVLFIIMINGVFLLCVFCFCYGLGLVWGNVYLSPSGACVCDLYYGIAMLRYGTWIGGVEMGSHGTGGNCLSAKTGVLGIDWIRSAAVS